MFEIWRHIASGERYLVAIHFGTVNVAAGPLVPGQDSITVLEGHTNQHHNPRALLHMRSAPKDFVREYTTDETGHAIPVTDQPLP